ncbi:MAG: methyl-accepting chemotaxis protein [Proteobacteria bacterium]|nr:methyl-accepting chemotaxis protein [Pseudomonadota bacterium]
MAAIPNTSQAGSDNQALWPLQAVAWTGALVAGCCAGALLSGGPGWLLAPGLALFAISLLAAIALPRRIARAVAEIERVVLALAEGRLVTRIDLAACGPFVPLAERMNGMARSLTGIFLVFSRMAQEISSVAGESNRNASGGDQGVRQQRDITLSSSATLEELSVSLNMTSESASGAETVAEASGKMAELGAERVAGLADSLGELAETVRQSAASAERLGQRSQEIDAIVVLISDIAAQTNLLALNAAIEAARVGEQGRGFAVVADEVRKLAERTSNATREIGERISGMRSEVEVMIGKMGDTRHSATASLTDAGLAVDDLRQLEDNAAQTLALIRDIAAASREQSEAGQSIARDIEQVAQLADTNEQLVRENSELSRYLDDLAGQLATTLKQYQYE